MAIQYPIKDTDRFTIFDTNTQQPMKDAEGKAMRNQKWASSDKSKMIEGLAPNIKWLIEVRQTQPAYDPDTQKLKRLATSYDVVNETATIESWEIVNLTQEEIDAKVPPHYDYDGIKVGIADTDQTAFANLLVLIDASGMPETDMIIIKDVYKNSHAMPVSEYRGFAVQYGIFCYSLFNAPPPEEPVDPML